MMTTLSALANTLFVRVLSVSLIALFGFFAIILLLFQTNTMFRLMPFAMADVSEPVSEIIFLVESVPSEAEPYVLAVFSSSIRQARLRRDFPNDADPRGTFSKSLSSHSPEAAGILSGREIRYRYLSIFDLVGIDGREDFAGLRAAAALEISIALDDGRVLSTVFAPAAVFSGQPNGVLALMIFAAVAIGAFTALLLGKATKPLRELEAAAERFGDTIDPEPAREIGAEEVRRVARALNRMQEKITSLMAERARMAAAIAHDIRTSITRIRLRLDQPDNLEANALERDLDQMQALLEDMLTYARSDQKSPTQELIDLAAFVKGYAADAPEALAIDASDCHSGFTIAADVSALTRALNNLVDNARRYGGGAKLSCARARRDFEIRIEDEGPGIPPEKLASVFEPFYRLEGSRSRETGGSGLGLGIARALIRALGGDVRLENRENGGLRATIVFADACRVD